MAGNFQGQMNMPGQMMDQQRQQQRPQGNAVAGHMQQMIYNALHQHTGPLEGWRAQVLVQERIALIMNIIGNLRLISQGPNAPNIEKMIEIGVKFEREIFEKSVDKESYKQESALKMQQLLERRNRNQPNMQQSINDQARMQAQAQQAAVQQQQMMMNQNGGQGQGQGQVPMQQGFHQLQHQMTATPIPGQNPPQMGMGMPNQGMPQNMTPNQQQQFQMAMQAQQQAQNGPQRPNMGLNAAAEAQVNAMVEKIMTRTSEEEKNNLRNQLRSRMDPTTANNYAANNIDPLRLYYKQQATANYRRQMAQNQVQQGQQPQRMISEQQGQNIQATAPPMQPQRSTNPSPMNAQTQPTTSAPGNPDFFAGSMIDQQQQGLMAEQAGQMVVPMSNAQRNATPQPGMAAQMNMNNQQAGANANAQRQQIFNAQQARLQQQQQQQSQQAARVNAQNKAQMGLQGQPGGISGPMPPLRSPAMETLNTPLRTPGPMNQAELPQGIPNPPFGQPQDPRFPQGYPRTPQQQMVLNTMPPELQQKMAAIPPERIEQVLAQYNQRRQAAAAAAAAQQAGRPPGAMPNGQMRPGQPMPQAQFNPQNAINQFLMANPGAQPPPQLMNGMTQAQQMMLRQQIARNSNPNPLQQRPPSQIAAIDPRAMQQMDGMDIPPAIITHPHMPRGIPQELKKWGQVKNWVQHSSQGLPPDSLAIVTNLQRMHYSTIIRSRLNGGQGPPGGVVPAGVPSVLPPGIAPVAHMGNPMQVPNMNMPQGGLPQVTPQDIHNIRNGNPNMAGATDDQIRNLIMKNRMQQYQQQTMRQNHLMQQQQMAMAQMNSQQPRPGMPPGQAQPGGQNIPAQMPQQKSQPAPEPVVPTPTLSRANRPAQVGRGNPPNSSPAEPPKNNLKRQSSEDVVEVPNPNTASQRTPQQHPIQKPGIPQQPMRANMSPEDLAKLPPEQQKKYEVAMMMYKLKQLATEEGQKAQTYPDVPMDANSKTRIINGLKSLLNPMNGMARSMSKWYQSTRDDNRARLFYRLQFRIKRQFKDEKFTEVKETLSMSLNDLEQGKQVLASMVEDLKTMAAPDMKKTNSSQAHPSPAANTQAAQAPPPTPLNAANLQQQQQQLNKMHQRSASRGGQPPAAPTSTHAPFQFGAVSPHGAGAPVYNGNAHTVTQKDLKIPPRKRQKGPDGTPSGLGTPGSNASPLMSKALSPEIKRQSTVEKPPAKPLLCCSEPDCERHNTGFETQEALDRHRQEEHVRPLADPTKYVQENLAAVLGLDAEGQPKANGGEKMIKADSKQGQTPIKVGTPMSRQDSMMRAPSSTGGKPMQKPDQTKPQSQAAVPMESPWSMATIDPQDLFSTFVNYDSAAGGSISDMNVYRSITPNESPESNSTTITDVSDISDGVNLDISLDLSFDETWMPFGTSELDALGGASTSLDNFDFGNDETTIPLAEDEAMVNYSTWDDTKQDFGKPFEFESDLFSMGY